MFLEHSPNHFPGSGPTSHPHLLTVNSKPPEFYQAGRLEAEVGTSSTFCLLFALKVPSGGAGPLTLSLLVP